ncbi:putative F-box/kelch-repeat protein At3g24610 [Raphanus sativus]|uniref:F-box/kelch-repeat protein At3g24610 n=1 Tax=Raphanus sativus TaxID=3726 RepID=A0A9W3BR43_RAPSA|nr:putative F-box/kelch-repeat protein At3g24610 [Raphanus sativus]
MKGRSAIRGCSGKKKKVSGLMSLPDDVFVDCLAQLSRLDLVALSMVSRRHRSKPTVVRLPPRATSAETDPSELVSCCSTRRILFREDGIGDLYYRWTRGRQTHIGSHVFGLYRSHSAPSCAHEDGENKKIYVFGGCWDAADSSSNSNWVEVYDIDTETWELLSVSIPKMPLKIKEIMVIDEKHVYTVDEDGEIFFFLTSECKFWTAGEKESDPENKNDWRLFDQTFFCRGVGGRILWRSLSYLDWKEVKGLEELQQKHIITICGFSVERMAIFWSQGPAYQTLELWFAEIKITLYCKHVI